MKHRKAQGYADPDRVAMLYNRFRSLRFEIDKVRKKRNEHSQLARSLVTIADDEEREKQLDRHSKVGKSYKR